jgi:uncharacterized membrane protein
MDLMDLLGACGIGLEAFGVLVVVIGSVYATINYVKNFKSTPNGVAYKTYRIQLGRSIMLGLEFLIAGDIIRTVIVHTSFESVTVLAIIILLRTFLSMTLHLEVEGRWPWEKEEKKPSS